jgi:CDP-glycerol glycerophosphotransferase
MLHFTYDYDKYASKRGMYFDIRDYVNGGATESEIFDKLLTMDSALESQKTIHFRDTFVNFYGNAAKSAVDYIANHVCNEENES